MIIDKWVNRSTYNDHQLRIHVISTNFPLIMLNDCFVSVHEKAHTHTHTYTEQYANCTIFVLSAAGNHLRSGFRVRPFIQKQTHAHESYTTRPLTHWQVDITMLIYSAKASFIDVSLTNKLQTKNFRIGVFGSISCIKFIVGNGIAMTSTGSEALSRTESGYNCSFVLCGAMSFQLFNESRGGGVKKMWTGICTS